MKRKGINIGYLYAIAVGVICGIIPVIIQKVLTLSKQKTPEKTEETV